jgi:hypothetical protein
MDERVRAVAFVFKLSIKTRMRAVNRAAAVRFLRSKRTTPDVSYLDESADGLIGRLLGLLTPYRGFLAGHFHRFVLAAAGRSTQRFGLNVNMPNSRKLCAYRFFQTVDRLSYFVRGDGRPKLNIEGEQDGFRPEIHG